MLEIKSFTFGPFQTNTYVVHDEQQILVVDPACSNEYERQQLLRYVEKLMANSQKPIAILATHGHLDHLWGAKWATETWQTPVLIHEADIPMVKAMQQQYNMFGIRASAEAFPVESLSDEAGLSIIPTPGHTPGSVCLYFPDDKILLSGDTLFQMGYGRTDLPGGNIGQLIASLERLFALPPDVRVYPGHGDSTTIAAERR